MKAAWHRRGLGLVAVLLSLPLVAALGLAVFGWNWARGPLQRIALLVTGRELRIGGDLSIRPGWPLLHVRAQAVTFANPPWAKQAQMVAVDGVDFTVDLVALLGRTWSLPEVHLMHPVVFLEQAADGRKSWLLDKAQADEDARPLIGRLSLDGGRFGFDDAVQKTHVQVDASTQDDPAGGLFARGLVFSAQGQYRGVPLRAQGRGGSALAWRDESAPYPLEVSATLGHTGVQAAGTVSSLLTLAAADLQLTLHGDSLASLFPLVGMALPETPAYTVSGRLVHNGAMWRCDRLAGRVGRSDIAGSVQVDTGGGRPLVKGELTAVRVDIGDLGPLIGKGPDAAAGPRVLPALPFRTERWHGADADIVLHAQALHGVKPWPLTNVLVRAVMRDAVLTLDPLQFDLAGGRIEAAVTLDGRQHPIAAQARASARKVSLARWLPSASAAGANSGEVNGKLDLKGSGDSLGRMLATADGSLVVRASSMAISKLLVEQAGLHLLEILQLKMSGDRPVQLRCAVAAFGVQRGVMSVRQLVVDTDISTIVGQGSIDLGQERFDLTLLPRTKDTSLVALRSPIHVRGALSSPDVALDKGRVVARGAGALALGLINPLLALIPLVELGPGLASGCDRPVRPAATPRRP